MTAFSMEKEIQDHSDVLYDHGCSFRRLSETGSCGGSDAICVRSQTNHLKSWLTTIGEVVVIVLVLVIVFVLSFKVFQLEERVQLLEDRLSADSVERRRSDEGYVTKLIDDRVSTSVDQV